MSRRAARRLAALRGLRALSVHAGRDQERDADAVRDRLPARLRGAAAGRLRPRPDRVSCSPAGPTRPSSRSRPSSCRRPGTATRRPSAARSSRRRARPLGRGASRASVEESFVIEAERPVTGDAGGSSGAAERVGGASSARIRCASRTRRRCRRPRRRRCERGGPAALAALQPRLLGIRAGRFASPLEHEGEVGAAVQACENVNTWPVLAAARRRRRPRRGDPAPRPSRRSPRRARRTCSTTPRSRRRCCSTSRRSATPSARRSPPAIRPSAR